MLKEISGLPGAGKGVYAMMQIINELRSTDRHIVTNLAVKLDPWVRSLGRKRSRGEKGLLAHLRDTYGETFDAEKRIHVVQDEQMKFFYTWRVNHDGQLIELPANRNKHTGQIESLELDAFSATQPMCYVADEAGQFWGARDWQKTADGLAWYNRQHRKAGDDFWVCVQHSSQLDKQMRTLFQEYHSLVNHKFRKIGIFKQPDKISVVVGNESPDMRSKLPILPTLISFDKVGLGGSFDTAAGVGVRGTGADLETKSKGLPWWGLFAGLVGIGVIVIFFAKGAGWFTGSLLTAKKGQVGTAMENKLETAKQQNPAIQKTERQPEPAVQKLATVTAPTNEVVILGKCYTPGAGWEVWLSDGTTLRNSDIRLIGIDYVVTASGKYSNNRQYKAAPQTAGGFVRNYGSAVEFNRKTNITINWKQ